MKAKKHSKSTKGLKAAKKLGAQRPLTKVPYFPIKMTNVD